MSDKQVITVIGATGSQGGAVVRALLTRNKWHVRAVTRDPYSAKGKNLASSGAEVVKADATDKDSLVKAFEGAHGAFLVTDFWGSCGCDPEVELKHGRNLVDAAKQAGVKHIVWSTLEDPRPLLKDSVPDLPGHPGRKVAHLETKAELQDYIDKSGVPATHVLTSSFNENTFSFFQYQKAPDGSYVYAMNCGAKGQVVPWVTVDNIGKTAAEAFEKAGQTPGNVIVAFDEGLDVEDVCSIVSKVTGKTVKYQPLPDDVVRGFPFPGAADIANMYVYFREGHDQVLRLREEKKRVVPATKFEDWAEGHKEELLAALSRADGASA